MPWNCRFPEPRWRAPALAPVPRRLLLALAAYTAGGFVVARAQPPTARICVLTPDSGEGPFYFDPELVRSDIADSRPGAPLEISLKILRVGDCAALERARVDVWHADALGLYSGYERQTGVGGISTEAAAAQSFLRGTQLTSADGSVRFRTIYPSWYRGRTPHVHFKVFLADDEVVASQIFFPEAVNERVFAQWEPYRTHAARRDTRNENDTFLTGRTDGVFCEAEASEGVVRAAAVIAVAPPA